jgi:hypothetical protein
MCRSLHIFCALVSIVIPMTSARADDSATGREDQFKAAYLFNFAKFVEWPPAAISETLTVCFLGGHGVYDALAVGIESKRVSTRRLLVRRLEPAASTDGCNALYLDAAAAANPPPTATLPVLTISDAPGFASSGGIIELFTENHRLRFLINVDSAQHVGLRISSDLLKLAAGVRRHER